jgi:hypothetical protein
MEGSLRIVFLGIAFVGPMLGFPIASSPALAADLSDQEEANGTTALRLYKEGRYEEAAKIFVALSVAHPDMLVFIRNTGACYYYLHRTEPALSSLREYLMRNKNISPDERAEVQGWITELEQIRQTTAGAAAIVASPAPAPVPAGQSAATARDGTALASPPQPRQTASLPDSRPSDHQDQQPNLRSNQPIRTIEPRPSAERQSSQSRDYLTREPSTGSPSHNEPSDRSVAPWIIGGLGVAVVATGGVFTYLSQSRFSEAADTYNAKAESSGKTYAYLAAAFYGLGAAGLVTSAILFLTSRDRAPSKSVALAPILAPNAVGATIHYGY